MKGIDRLFRLRCHEIGRKGKAEADASKEIFGEELDITMKERASDQVEEIRTR